MSRQRYAKCQPSGIAWLGELPDHWDAKRLKFLVSEPLKYGANEAAELDDPTLPRYIRITDVDDNGRLRKDTFKSIPEIVAQPYLLRDGDLLLARSGATVGKSFHYEPSWGRAAFAGYLIRARFNPTIMIPRFVNYFTNSEQYWQWLNSSFIQATIQNVSAEKYANLMVPVPPFEEQKQVGTFLDRETGRIDALIEKKQRQIELLQEKRTALISHAVTKGLDPNVNMKDSGIEWLGEIPEHWDIQRMKFLSSKTGSGKTPRGGAEVYVDSGVLLLRSQNIHFDGLRLDDAVFIDPDVDAEMANSRVRSKDVLLNITGASLGRVSLVPDEMPPANVNQHVCIIRPRAKVVRSEYLFMATCSRLVQSQIFANENGTSREGLNFQQIGNLHVPLPRTLEEQDEISKAVHAGITHIDSSISKVLKSCDLLREYRTALISAAVTGKIDLREVTV
jgi:type I restriction enzyme S subunit